jgi:hypothetical protein
MNGHFLKLHLSMFERSQVTRSQPPFKTQM